MAFDIPINRFNTYSQKWEKYRGRDVIPLWVADMDFRSPPSVLDALHKYVDHGIFGYAVPPAELVDIILSRLERLYGWKIKPESIVWLPGLVPGINLCCRSAGRDGDSVITTTPVYPPFLTAPGYSRRNLISVPMIEEEGLWLMDFDMIRDSITEDTKLFILCNPHNPTGRVFRKDELLRLAEICEANNLIICSDEIHCDLIMDNNLNHIPIASLDPEIAKRTITLMAPSKTYNLAGLGCSFAIIENQRLRKRFIQEKAGILPDVTITGFVAALAAYRDGDEWLEELLEYLRKNHKLVLDTVKEIPNLSMKPAEATYLAWIDARKIGVENPALFFEKYGVGLSDGADFGRKGFVRLNFGCPLCTLEEALKRIKRALEKI